MTTTDIFATALTVASEGERLFIAHQGMCWEWEGLIGFRMTAEWQSRSFLIGNKTNFSSAIVESFINDEDEEEAEKALILVYDDYLNSQNGFLNGALGMLPQSEAGMSLDGVSYEQFAQKIAAYDSVTVTFYANGKAIFTKDIHDREPFVLPSGFTARTWFVRVRTNRDIRRIAMAESMSELYE